jgi:hypothetical protein
VSRFSTGTFQAGQTTPTRIASVIQECTAELVCISLVAREVEKKAERQAHVGQLAGWRTVVCLLATTLFGYALGEEFSLEQFFASLFECCVGRCIQGEHELDLF